MYLLLFGCLFFPSFYFLTAQRYYFLHYIKITPFGTPDGHKQYPTETNKKLFEQFAADRDKEIEFQLIIYRKQQSIYYTCIQTLSNQNDYFGICVVFNGIYCSEPKKLYNCFCSIVRNEIINKRKILKTDQNDNVVFQAKVLISNKVDFDELEKKIKEEIAEQLGSSFVSIDPDFLESNDTKKIVYKNETTEYILNTSKAYQYVIITTKPKEKPHNRTKFENKIDNFIENHKWLRPVCLVFFFVVMALLIFLLITERCSLCGALWLEIPLVASLYFYFFKKFTNGNREMLLALFSFVVSIIGLTLTIDNSVFSESNGEYGNIIKRSFQKHNTIDISEKLNEWDSVPHLVFVLDVSGSIKSEKYNNKEECEELFNDVCRQMRSDTANIDKVLRNFLHNKEFAEYTEYDIYKLKILKIIAEKQEMYENKIDIVCFAGNVEHKKNIDCNKIIRIINNVESNQKFMEHSKTDFINLIDKLSNLYSVTTKRDNSNAPKFTFLFFSDYNHDVGKKFTNKENKKITDTIKELVYNFYSQQNFSNYFFTNASIQKSTEKEISVLPIFEELIDENSKAHLVQIEDDKFDFMDILPKEVVPIYYEHSYPKNDLRTDITFKKIGNKEKVRITLKKNPHNITDCHHQFSVYENDNLVSPVSEVELSPEKLLILTFSGRIIDTYNSTLLTFQSANRGFARFDIVFFKDLPWFCRYIIAVTIFFSYLCLLSITVSFFNYKNNSKFI
jgi:hypothetical protein